MDKSILARIISSTVPIKDELISISLPRELNYIVNDLLNYCNNKASKYIDENQVPFALEVVPFAEEVDLPRIRFSEMAKYRANSRLFVWLSGDIDPDSSFKSTVSPFIPEEFPSIQSSKFSLSTMANGCRKILSSNYPDMLAGNEWDTLEDVTKYILNYLAEAFQKYGNEDLQWTSAWWLTIDNYFTNLQYLFDNLESGGLDPVKHQYSSAGLPIPEEQNVDYKKMECKNYVEIIQDRWCSKNSIKENMDWLSVQMGKTPALASLDWEEYYIQNLKTGHKVSTLLLFGSNEDRASDRIKGWMEIDEKLFLRIGEIDKSLIPLKLGYNDKLFPEISNIPLYILPLGEIGSKENDTYILDNIYFILPLINKKKDSISIINNTNEYPQIIFESNKICFIPSHIAQVNDDIYLYGKLSIEYGLIDDIKNKVIKAQSKVEKDSTLFGIVQNKCSCKLIIPFGEYLTILVTDGKKKVEIAPAIPSDANSLDYNHSEVNKISLETEINGKVYSYDGKIEHKIIEKCRVKDKLAKNDHNWMRTAYIGNIKFEDGLRIYNSENEDCQVEISITETLSKPWLPLAATAIESETEKTIPKSNTMKADLRGILEDLYRDSLIQYRENNLNQVPEGGFLQVILPLGNQYNFQRYNLLDKPTIKWLSTNLDSSKKPLQGPSSEFLNSNEVKNFWLAFSQIIKEIYDDLKDNDIWFCQVSLKNIDRHLIDNYLNSFIKMVKVSCEYSHQDYFWANYPFSAFLFEPKELRIKAIMLSSLHPVRLAWIYGVEISLNQQKKDNGGWRSLIQIIEGWNFPWVGPGKAMVAHSYDEVLMVAVPLDPGEEQLFLSWSMLVYFDNSAGSQLKIPEWASGIRVPGGSLSGLNAGGISAVFRDYLRVYPHTTTVHIDLFSSGGPRSKEVDEAILDEANKIKDKSSSNLNSDLVGGIRVFDSENRLGLIPSREKVAEIIDNNSSNTSVRFEWTRYKQDEDPIADIRLVEDAQVNVSKREAVGTGVVPFIPIKRFATRTILRETGSKPIIKTDISFSNIEDGWNSFIDAVNIMEKINKICPALIIDPVTTFLGINARSKWLITGNVNIDPSTLSTLINSDENINDKMLWEWRPAYYARHTDKKSTPRFARRSYNIIAKIPKAFYMLLQQKKYLDYNKIDIIFNVLGSRGVGLASLLAMGGNHVTGALGFYFGYKIIDNCICKMHNKTVNLVIPIDSADNFLKDIGNIDSKGREYSKRADLLLIRITDIDSEISNITFIPIEITFREMKVGENSFPNQDSKEVKNKLEQLHNTHSMIKQMLSSYNELDVHDNNLTAIYNTALAQVIESGFILGKYNYDNEVQSTILYKVLYGKTNYKLGDGLLFWFVNQESNDKSYLFKKDIKYKDNQYASLFINISRNDNLLWGEANESESEAICELANFIEISCNELNDEKTNVRLSGKRDLDEQDEQDNDINKNEDGRCKVYLGQSIFNDDEVYWDPFHPAKKLINAHSIVIGSSGSGKTQMLKVFIKELSDLSTIPLVLDFKDDYIDNIFLETINSQLIQAMDGLPVNPLMPHPDFKTNEISIVKQVYQISSIFKKVFSLGDQQEADLKEAMYKTYETVGIDKKTKILEDDKLIPSFDLVGDFILENNQKLYNRLSPLFDLGLFESSNYSLDSFFSKPTVVRFSNLPGEEIKKITAEILLNGLYNNMMKLGHYVENNLKLVLVIDEAHKIANLESIKSLMKESRAFGISLLLSSQEARDFEDYVFSNAGTLCIMKVSETKDANRVSKLITGNNELTDKIQSLNTFEFLIKNQQYMPFKFVRLLPFYIR